MGFCDVVLGWDSSDQLYDNVSYTGWHTGYPDANVRVLPETCRDDRRPTRRHGCSSASSSTSAEEVCPRAHCCAACSSGPTELGYEVKAATEFEFFMFEETPQSMREKGYSDLKPMTPGFFGYSVLRNSRPCPTSITS